MYKPRDIAEEVSKHFQLVYDISCPGTFRFINQSTEILSLVAI
jgi:hypothetical protein